MAYQSTTIKAIRQQVMTELGLGLVLGNATLTLASGSLTSTRLVNPQWGSGYLSGLGAGFFRPDAATSPDYFRYCGDLTNSSGLVAVTPTYSDTTVGSEIAEVWFHCGSVFRPDIEILNAINYCLQFEMIPSFSFLSHGGDNDFDMQNSATSSYTNSNATLTKSATAARILYGIRGLRVANSGANGYAESASISVTKQQAVTVFGLVSTAAQTPSLTLWDSTNSTSLASITTAESEPQLLQIPWTNVGSTTTALTLRLGGASASCDAHWNAIWLYKLNETWFDLPSYLSEQFKIIKIMQLKPIMASSQAYVYYGRGLNTEPLEEGRDYNWTFNHGDANPYRINFTSPQLFDWPLMVQCKRPASDFGTFSGADETQTTVAPLHTLIPRIKLFLLNHVLIPGYPGDDKWTKLRSIAQKELDEALGERPSTVISEGMPYYAGIGRL